MPKSKPRPPSRLLDEPVRQKPRVVPLDVVITSNESNHTDLMWCALAGLVVCIFVAAFVI